MRIPSLAEVRVVVDRFEGDSLEVAVTEWTWPDCAGGESLCMRDLPRSDLPPDAREGTVLGVRLVIEVPRVVIQRPEPAAAWEIVSDPKRSFQL